MPRDTYILWWQPWQTTEGVIARNNIIHKIHGDTRTRIWHKAYIQREVSLSLHDFDTYNTYKYPTSLWCIHLLQGWSCRSLLHKTSRHGQDLQNTTSCTADDLSPSPSRDDHMLMLLLNVYSVIRSIGDETLRYSWPITFDEWRRQLQTCTQNNLLRVCGSSIEWWIWFHGSAWFWGLPFLSWWRSDTYRTHSWVISPTVPGRRRR